MATLTDSSSDKRSNNEELHEVDLGQDSSAPTTLHEITEPTTAALYETTQTTTTTTATESTAITLPTFIDNIQLQSTTSLPFRDVESQVSAYREPLHIFPQNKKEITACIILPILGCLAFIGVAIYLFASIDPGDSTKVQRERIKELAESYDCQVVEWAFDLLKNKYECHGKNPADDLADLDHKVVKYVNSNVDAGHIVGGVMSLIIGGFMLGPLGGCVAFVALNLLIQLARRCLSQVSCPSVLFQPRSLLPTSPNAYVEHHDETTSATHSGAITAVTPTDTTTTTLTHTSSSVN